MSNQPKFASNGIIGIAQITTGNTAKDGTGTLTTVVTGSVTQTIITSVRIKFQVTTTAGAVRFFIYNTTDNRLIHEEDIPATTSSGTEKAYETTWIPTEDLILPANYVLKATCENSEAVNIIAYGGDY